MTFLKQNWIKIVLVLLALAFGLYYLVVITPADSLDAKIANCKILGREYKSKERTENPDREFLFPVWAYNQSLGLCLYRNGYYEKEWWNRYIVDLNTNKIIEYSNYKFPSLSDDSDYEYSSGLTSNGYGKKEDGFFRGSNIFTE